MDDWASPWADEEQSQQSTNTRETEVKVTTRPPGNATILGERINSPWDNIEEDDNDEFGDWSVPVEEKLADPSLKFEQSNEGWHMNVGDQGGLVGHVIELAPGWKGNTTLSDSLVLSPGSTIEHSMRQPSPDPWATGFPEYVIGHVDKEEDPVEGPPELEKGAVGAAGPLGSVVLQDPAPAHKFEGNKISISESEPVRSPESKRNSVAEVDRSSSQPSSSPSVISQHEDGRQESPRTSMEDETHRPHVSRKASSNIQEVAKQFDGPVKQVDDPGSTSCEALQATGRQQASPTRAGDDTGDTTDSMDDISDDEGGPEHKSMVPESPNNMKHITLTVAGPSSIETNSTLPSASSSDGSVQNSLDPVNVDIDLSFLEKLFPSDSSELAGDIFIPDAIPHDSFGSTDERKMWYRISRYGPMLKHNSGDDENYVRMSWPKSTIRDDTLKIVARWMEEDRLSGHVVLGGGGKTSTLFGWGDSKAPAVSMASAFASRDIKNTQKSLASQPVPPNAANTVSPLPNFEHNPFSLEPVKSVALPVVNFAWNCPPQNLPQSSAHPTTVGTLTKREHSTPPIIPSARPSTLRPIVLPKTLMPIESPQQTPVPASASISRDSTDSILPVVELADKIDEGDDDWGDMVSTPTATVFKSIPFSNGELHKKPTERPIISDTISTTPRNEAFGNEQILNLQSPIASSRQSEVTIHPIAATESNRVPSAMPSTLGDPWASADFSFFDASVTPLPASAPSPAPTPVASPAAADPPFRTPVSFNALPSRALQAPKTPRPPAPPPLSVASRPSSRDKVVQEELVQSIIKGLPDLSYMLRR